MIYDDIFDLLNENLQKQDVFYLFDKFFEKKIVLQFTSENIFRVFDLKFDYIFQYMFESGYLYYISSTINIEKLYQQIDNTQKESLVYAVNFPHFIIKKVFPTVKPVIFNFYSHKDTLEFICNFYIKIQKTTLTDEVIRNIGIKHPYLLLYLFFTQKNIHTTYLKNIFPILQKQNKLFLYSYSRYQYNSEGLNFLNDNNSLHYISNFEPIYLKEPFYVEFFLNSVNIYIYKQMFIFENLFINDIDYDTYKKVFNKLWTCIDPSFNGYDCFYIFESLNKSFDSKFINHYVVIILKMIDFYKSFNNTQLYYLIYETYCIHNEFIHVIKTLIDLNIDLLTHQDAYPKEFSELITTIKEMKNF